MDINIAAVTLNQLVKLDFTSCYRASIIDQEGKKSQCEDQVLAVRDNVTPEETNKTDKKSKCEDDKSLREKYSSDVTKVHQQFSRQTTERFFL